MSDKIIITNSGALRTRYGAAGYQVIQQALGRLIAADQNRGLTTVVVAIDDPAQMNAFQVAAVPAVAAPVETKQAVNAILAARDPAYLMILGGPDIVCHQPLTNPVPGDGDANVPSDLPYASTSPFGVAIAGHLGATHVVGRLPDIPNATNPAVAAPNPQDTDFLVNLIDHAAQAQPRPAAQYQQCFGLSAQVWSVSAQLSLSAIFGGTPPLLLAPPVGPPVAANVLQPLSHFINCHGAQADFHYYGQQGNAYPVAMETPDIAGKIQNGCVVATECCYGSEIYDPTLAGGMGLCCRYLLEGAYGYFGSTNIAYGPATSNANADLIAQYFMHEIVANGASTGRACLAARQRFVQAAGAVMSQVDLKTIGQYLLLGDPSLQPTVTPVTEAETVVAVAGALDAQEQARTARRHDMYAKGIALPRAVLWPDETPAAPPPPPVLNRLMGIAAQLGMNGPRLSSFEVVGEPTLLANTKAAGQAPIVHLLVEPLPRVGGIPAVHALVIFQFDARLVPRHDSWSR